MLLITISRPKGVPVLFADFERYQLPLPSGGADAEVNGVLILKFEDEKEAVDYAKALEDHQNASDDKDTPKYAAISQVINAVYEDEFVRSYRR